MLYVYVFQTHTDLSLCDATTYRSLFHSGCSGVYICRAWPHHDNRFFGRTQHLIQLLCEGYTQMHTHTETLNTHSWPVFRSILWSNHRRPNTITNCIRKYTYPMCIIYIVWTEGKLKQIYTHKYITKHIHNSSASLSTIHKKKNEHIHFDFTIFCSHRQQHTS